MKKRSRLSTSSSCPASPLVSFVDEQEDEEEKNKGVITKEEGFHSSSSSELF